MWFGAEENLNFMVEKSCNLARTVMGCFYESLKRFALAIFRL
jgi:hypothetical protein